MGSSLLRGLVGIAMSGPPSPSGLPWPTAEVMAWRASLEDKLISLRDLLTTRIEAMEKVAQVQSDNVNRVPTLLDREAARLQVLLDERTANIRTTIKERDDQAHEDKVAAAKQWQLALSSLKELISSQNSANSLAIAKAEDATTNDLTSLSTLITATKDVLNGEINNLKQRMDRGEGTDRGQRLAVAETHSNIGSVTLLIGSIVGVIGIVMTILSFSSAHSSAPPPAPVAPVNPTVGADTKRVDDLIAQTLQSARDTTARLDALSARLNTLQQRQQPYPGQPNP